MIAVSDASPIRYLIDIGEAGLLERLFSAVLVPQQVLDELRAGGAPAIVRAWANSLPSSFTVLDTPNLFEPTLRNLHAGERAAILLAESSGADIVLLDEKAARKAAAGRGLRVTGLLGVLVEAANRDLCDLPAAIQRLAKTSFHCSPALLKAAVERFPT